MPAALPVDCAEMDYTQPWAMFMLSFLCLKLSSEKPVVAASSILTWSTAWWGRVGHVSGGRLDSGRLRLSSASHSQC